MYISLLESLACDFKPDFTQPTFGGIYNMYSFFFPRKNFSNCSYHYNANTISSVWSKNQLHWGKKTKAMHCYVAHVNKKTYSKEIHPEVTTFSRAMDSECFPASIGAGAAFLSKRASKQALVPVQPSSAKELPSKHWCRCSLPQQKSFPATIGAGAAFLSKRASQQPLVPVQPSSAKELPETAVKAWKRCILAELQQVSHCCFFVVVVVFLLLA